LTVKKIGQVFKPSRNANNAERLTREAFLPSATIRVHHPFADLAVVGSEAQGELRLRAVGGRMKSER
jgi:hypothetical protein